MKEGAGDTANARGSSKHPDQAKKQKMKERGAQADELNKEIKRQLRKDQKNAY